MFGLVSGLYEDYTGKKSFPNYRNKIGLCVYLKGKPTVSQKTLITKMVNPCSYKTQCNYYI